MPPKGEFKFEIIKEMGVVLSTNRSGWNREINLVSWNGAAPKLDIRDWSPEHDKMGKGLSMTSEEVAILKEFLENYDPYSSET